MSLKCNEPFFQLEFALPFLLTPTYHHGQQTEKIHFSSAEFQA